METLTKILEKIGESMARFAWMYGARVYRRSSYSSRLRQGDR